MKLEIHLKPYQFDFIYSTARHPAIVAGWGTGKSMCGIMRALIYSKMIPNNLGIIFRKTYRSLADSTLKDFEKYTNLKVNAERNVVFPNGSVIMFRYIDELDSINQQNINLGWYMIEQGEELDNENEFFMLFGRLRRNVEPSDDFKKLKLPERSGWIVANAGDNWIKILWKDGGLQQAQKEINYDGNFSELVEATTLDNADNLAPDFLKSLELMRVSKPDMYKRFVLNDWSIADAQHILISNDLLNALKQVILVPSRIIRHISCDPSTGGDECIIYCWENTRIIDTLVLHYNDTMKIVGEIMLKSAAYKTDEIAIDTIGIGKGVGDRLTELKKHVTAINSAEKARNEAIFYNLRTEMWWNAFEMIQARSVQYPEDQELRRQLSAVKYRIVNSNGLTQIEPKQETKKRLGQSPDRGDAFIYGLHNYKRLEAMPIKHKGIDYQSRREEKELEMQLEKLRGY